MPNTWQSRQVSRVTEPTIQLCAAPKSAAPCPPAKLLAPIGSNEKPIAVTTVAATIGEMILIQYFAKRPRIPSTMPPMMTAPINVPIPLPVPMTMARERNVKLIPITIGSLEPILQTGKSWMNVPIPAIIIQFWINAP